MTGPTRIPRVYQSVVFLLAAIQLVDGFLCSTCRAVGGEGSVSDAVGTMSSLRQTPLSSSSSSPPPPSTPPRVPALFLSVSSTRWSSRRRGGPQPSSAALSLTVAASPFALASAPSPVSTSTAAAAAYSRQSRRRSDDVFTLNLSPYEEYLATRRKKEKGEAVEPEQNRKASLFERFMKSREKQATLSPEEKEKSIFEEYSQTRPTPAAAPTAAAPELSPYEEYMASRKKLEAAEAATTAEEKEKASLFSKYLASRGLTAEAEAQYPKEERAAMFAKYVASRMKARVSSRAEGVGRWLVPILKRLPGGKKFRKKEEEEEDKDEEAVAPEDAPECSDPDAPNPINGGEIADGVLKPNWSLDIEYTPEEKIALFDDYMASREKVAAAAAQVTPEEVEAVSAYGEYLASRARKEAALAQMAPEEKTKSLFEEYMTSRAPAAGKNIRSSVVHLTKSTFDGVAMDPSKHALVYFYAPWCIHCQNLDQDFEKLGKVFESDSSVVVAKVNAIDEKELKQRLGVKKYPTLQYFPPGPGGTVEVYKGPRDLDSLVGFLNFVKQAGAKQPQQKRSPTAKQLEPQQKKQAPGGKHVGTGGMADTRDPEPLKHEDPRKSIAAAPTFEEYLKSKKN